MQLWSGHPSHLNPHKTHVLHADLCLEAPSRSLKACPICSFSPSAFRPFLGPSDCDCPQPSSQGEQGGMSEPQRRGWPWSSARHWVGRAGLGWGGEQCGRRSPPSLGAQCLALGPSLLATPAARPLPSFPSPFQRSGHWGGPQERLSEGAPEPETPRLVAQYRAGAGAGALPGAPSSLRSLRAWGPQAESPPPELFFLGLVFSVLEASGCGVGRKTGLSPVPPPLLHFLKLWPMLSPQFWALS